MHKFIVFVSLISLVHGYNSTTISSSLHNHFGYSVSTASNWIAVGESAIDATHVYDCSAAPHCALVTTLVPFDGDGSDLFGFTTGIASNGLLVGGAPAHNLWNGGAYVYKCSFSTLTCPLITKIVGDTASSARFGQVVSAASIGLVAVSAFGEFTGIAYGAAYAFNCASWTMCTRIAKFTSDGRGPVDYGYSIAAASNGLMLVGAPSDGTTGAVYMYDCSSMSSCAFVVKMAPAGSYYYGSSVAMASSGLAVISSFEKNGFASVYDCSSMVSCSPVSKLAAFDPVDKFTYGSSVSVGSDGYVLVGSPNDLNSEVYLYNCSSLTYCDMITRLSGTSSSFGKSVSISSARLFVVGAYVESSATIFSVPNLGEIYGDPHFNGFNGVKYNFYGTEGHVYAIYSDVKLQINAALDRAMSVVNGTWMSEIGIMTSDVRIAVSAEMGIVVKDGASVELEMTNSGQLDSIIVYLNVATIKITVQQPFKAKPYLNLQMTLHSVTKPHGVLGQSVDVDFACVEGRDEDYLVDDLFSTRFAYSRFF